MKGMGVNDYQVSAWADGRVRLRSWEDKTILFQCTSSALVITDVMQIFSSKVESYSPLLPLGGIGATTTAAFALPASAPGGNNWLLRVLDSTANPPTTEWYNPGSGSSFAYVDYDTSSNQLQHVVPGASAVDIHRIRVNEFIYAQLYVLTGNLYLTNAVQNGILYCSNSTNGLMTTKNTFRFDETVETLYLTNLSGSRLSVVDINAIGIIDSEEFRCKNLGAIFYRNSPGTTTPLSFDLKADVASGSQIQLLTSGGIHFETSNASQIFLFSHRVGSTVTDSLEISSSLIDAKVPLQTVGIDVTGTLKIYDTANSGTNNAQLIIDGTYGLRFDHPDGYLFRRGNSWKLLIGSTNNTCYNNLVISSAGQQGHLTVDGDITWNTAQISSADRNMNVLFHDNGTGDKRIKEKDTFHFNPSSNILTTPNLTVEGTSTFENNVTVANGATVDLTDNASSISLLTGSIFNHATNAYMGFRGQYTTGLDYNIGLWNDGHVRYRAMGSAGHRFYVTDPTTSTTDQVLNVNLTTVDVYKNLNIRGNAQIQADNDFTFLEASQTAQGDKGVIFWQNIGRLIGRRTGTLETEVQLVNEVARNTVDFQLSCQENKTLINTPNVNSAGMVDIRVGNFQTLLVESIATTVKNFLKLEQADVPAVDEELPLLCKREADDLVYKTQSLTTTYNPTSDTLSANNFNATAATIAADGLTYNAQVPTAGGARELLLLNSNGIIKKADPSLQYDPITQVLTADTCTVQNIQSLNALIYGGGFFVCPLNYTFRVGHTSSVVTVGNSGTGSNNWGLGNKLGILRTLVKATAYGANLSLWTWNAYDFGTNLATTFTYTGIPGLLSILVTLEYTSDVTQSGTSRVNPIIRALVNNLVVSEGTESSYIRNGYGRVGTVRYEMKLALNPNDTIQFATYINVGTGFTFVDTVTSAEYDIDKFMFMATYLGPLDEYDVTVQP